MKKLEKIKLHEVTVLTDSEMKMVFGGGDEEEELTSGSTGDCGGTKVSACDGKSKGDSCCFTWKGHKYYGTCQRYAPNYKIHCSDLN